MTAREDAAAKMVPREATELMADAAVEAFNAGRYTHPASALCLSAIWRAMFDAAPPPAAPKMREPQSQEDLICIGFDAMRILFGMVPTNWTPEEIVCAINPPITAAPPPEPAPDAPCPECGGSGMIPVLRQDENGREGEDYYPCPACTPEAIAAPAAPSPDAGLIERLREPIPWEQVSDNTVELWTGHARIIDALLEDAAAALAARDAEVERLREERTDWARRFMLDGLTPWEWESRAKKAESERDAAQADAARLRESLTDILSLTAQHTWTKRDQPRISAATRVLVQGAALAAQAAGAQERG